MAWGFTYIFAALIGFILSIYAVKKKDILGFRYFAAFAFFQSFWSLGYGLELLLPGYLAKVIAAKIEYIPIVIAPILWMVFALSYTIYAKLITRKRLMLLGIIPAITIALVATNELHGLIWAKLELFDTGLGIEMINYSHGYWFWIQIAYSYTLFVVSLVALVRQLFISSEHYKSHIIFILFSALVPFFCSAVYLFDSEFLFDLTPLGFCGSIILIMWGFFFSNLFGLKSTAREAVLDLMQDAVIVTDEQNTILDLNQTASDMLNGLVAGNDTSILHGKHIDSVFPISSQFISFDDPVKDVDNQVNKSLLGVGEFTKIHIQLQDRLEKQLKSQLSKTDAGLGVLEQLPTAAEANSDSVYSLELSLAEKIFNVRVSNFRAASKQRGRVLVIHDISVQKEQDKLLEEMIFTDKLTGLYNRYSFMQYGKLLMQQNVSLSLLLIDLDRFKNVNDSLGHSVGDDLLIQVSKRLANIVSESDTLARLGTDEFAILMSGQKEHKARSLAEDILFTFRSPFNLQGQIVHMNASIGIVSGSVVSDNKKSNAVSVIRDDADIEDLLRHADIAMYEAKHQGLGYSIYNAKETVKSIGKLNLETELMHAIEHSEFDMFYQPIVQAHNSELVGFEALLRWKKGDEYVAPAQFLSFAEEVGIMKLIDYWVLEQVMTVDKAQLPRGFVALNLSGITLRDTGLLELAKKLISDGYSAENIVLEVTESAMMNVSTATSILNELKALGFQIAIDDFGTGYSSLSYIEQFPLDILKIDKSFVSGIQRSIVSEALLRTIINLGQNLGVVVLAEGIETPEQLKWLRDNDCLYIQGHLFGWPKPVSFYKDGFVAVEIIEVPVEPVEESQVQQSHSDHTESTDNRSQVNII